MIGCGIVIVPAFLLVRQAKKKRREGASWILFNLIWYYFPDGVQ